MKHGKTKKKSLLSKKKQNYPFPKVQGFKVQRGDMYVDMYNVASRNDREVMEKGMGMGKGGNGSIPV